MIRSDLCTFEIPFLKQRKASMPSFFPLPVDWSIDMVWTTVENVVEATPRMVELQGDLRE